jgi:S-DNA-T family DNA segregation ATPase FtsK/SpoIIIE
MQSSQPVARRQPPPRDLADVFVCLAIALVAGWLLVAWAIVKRPILSVPVAAYVGLVVWLGGHDAQALALYAIGLLVAWRLVHKRSYQRLVGRRLRASFRRLWVYESRWRRTMVHCGLGKRYRLRESVPRIRRVRSSPWGDRVLVRLVVGQCTEDIEAVAPELAHSFGARACRVREDRPGRLWLEFATGDPLTEIVPALAVPEVVDLHAVAVGLREDGEPWRLRVLGTHLLIAGATGSGKGSVLWSLLRGLAPEIRSGRVAVWAIDPKGGMELGPGRALFARFCGDEFAAMAQLLDDAVAVMQDRARRLAGVTRLHEPTIGEPLILVVVDEVATLSAYLPDRKLRDRMAHSLGLLLTQGRAVGVSVVAALQDPRKEVLDLRNLFPARVGLRLDEPLQIDMVLGAGAREQGARCDRIPASLPGVGYVRLDGDREPTRVRAGYVTDQDIAAMAAQYGPRVSAAGRLRAVLEGRVEGGPVLTDEQRREVGEIRSSWDGRAGRGGGCGE